MFIRSPNKKHLYKIIHVNNKDAFDAGKSWIGAADAFVTAAANPCMKFWNAPKGKAFRIFSVHFEVSTIHISQSASGVQMSTMNFNLQLKSLERGNDELALKETQGRIASTRMYYNKIGTGGLVHDANGDSTYDAATDHRNPFSVSDWRTYDPSPHWVFPNGIDVGSALVGVMSHGSAQNCTDYTPSETDCFIYVEYELINKEHYEKLYGPVP